jgi:hypothetical protein
MWCPNVPGHRQGNAIYENGRIDPMGLAAVSRLPGNNYAKIDEVFEIQRPK